MKDATIRRLLNASAEHLGTVMGGFQHARANWSAWADTGHPETSNVETSLGGARHGGASDPVGAKVERLADSGRSFDGDWPKRQDRRLGVIASKVEKLLREAAELVENATTAADIPGADGCALCDAAVLPRGGHRCDAKCRADGHRHPDRWKKVYSRSSPAGTDLPNIGRCTWHYEFAERQGVDATPRLTLWHLDHPGQHAPRALIREEIRDPEVLDAVQSA